MMQLPEERETNGGAGGDAVGTKRQRRPSVRLGDVGGGDVQYQRYHKNYYSDHQLQRRATKQNGRTRPLPNPKSSKQTLGVFIDNDNGTNSSSYKNKSDKDMKKKKNSNGSGGSGSCENNDETEEDFGDGVAIGSWKIRDLKSKRGIVNAKRARSNWASKLNENHDQTKCSNAEIIRNFEPINSEEDEEEKEDADQQEVHDNASPIRSSDDNDNDNDNGDDNGDDEDNVNAHLDDVDVERERDTGRRRGVRFVGEIDGPSDSSEMNGVRAWLNKLGLGRYAPVFEIHEVDDQVLPLLTLDDLKDMGINAVGSRRKIFCSIQKLNKGFS